MKWPVSILLVLFIAVVSMFLNSCEKEVYIDLNSANPRLVVQGDLTTSEGSCIVKLNRSVNYYDGNSFPTVSAADVSISNGSGYMATLNEGKPGVYEVSILRPTYLDPNFTLKIIVDGKEYTASSTLPSVVGIDSVLFEKNNRFGSSTGYRVICKFRDPPGIRNYYRLRLSSNDTAAGIDLNSIRLASDKYTDGEEMRISYPTNLLANYSVNVDLESIDKATYDFFYTLRNVAGEANPLMSAPPANPTSNISNGALGYFAAYSTDRKTVVIR